jgi:aspartate aminotransferase
MANSNQIHLSRRAQEMPASPIRKFIPLAEEAKKRGIRIYHLNIGQPDIPTPEEFMRAVKNYNEEVLAYGNSQGSAPLLEELVRYYQRYKIHLQTRDIVVTTGGSEAIIFAMICVADADDEIIVFEPFYTNYSGFARMADVRLIPVTTYAETGFHLPEQKKIEEKVTPKTKAILVSSPGNPTGVVYTMEELEMLASICKKHNLFLLSDEVYREFVYDGKHVSAFELEGMEDRIVLLDSISKRFSACGARVGCIVSKNQEVMSTALRLGQARLCSPSIEQHAAAQALKIPRVYFEKIKEEYRKRRDLVFEELLQIPQVVCIRPQGAFYIMAKLPVADVEDFTRWMLTDFDLENETTMLAPGPGFYATPGKGKDEARIAYVLNVDDLRKAMRILKRGIQVYNQREAAN